MTTRRNVTRQAGSKLFENIAEERFYQQDDAAQDHRWFRLAKTVLKVSMPDGALVERAALAPDGMLALSPITFRCGAEGCRLIVGELLVVESDWHGSPFAWAEMQRVVDASVRPPLVRMTNIVLDEVTAALSVQGDCVEHGCRSVSVAIVLDKLKPAMTRALSARESKNPDTLAMTTTCDG